MARARRADLVRGTASVTLSSPTTRLPDMRGGPPGALSRALARRLAAVESRNVTYLAEDFPVFWSRARAGNVWDADGNRYVDLTAGFGVAAAGHAHPRIVAAIQEQAGRLVHGMGDVHPPAVKVELLERLAEEAPFPDARTILAISGSDAVEVALKTARLHSGKPGVLAFTGAYHGLGYGALAVTDRDHFRRPFQDQLNPHVLRAAYPHPYRPGMGLRIPARSGPPAGTAEEELEWPPAARVAQASLDEVEELLNSPAAARVGAVILEPVQGRGGDVVPPPGFLERLALLSRRRRLLLILDEIYTGFGRTGSRFACEAEGVVPDLLCVGKSLSGAMPISACLAPRKLMDAWPPSRGEAIHTSTFLGHPVACAAALASLDVLTEEGLIERAREVGADWRRALARLAERHPSIGDVRGRGLMVGLDLVRDRGTRQPDGALAARVVGRALRRGWILLGGGPDGNVLSLSPPLSLERAILDAAVEMLDEALAEAAASA